MNFRKKVILATFAILVLVLSGMFYLLQSGIFTGFASLVEGDGVGFQNGTYENVAYNGSSLILFGGALSGKYTSRVFDLGSTANWNSITWEQDGCYGCALPGTGSDDWPSPLSMNGAVLLLHLDDSSNIVDSYGSHQGSAKGIGGASGMFGNSLHFSGGLIDFQNLNFNHGAFSVGFWFKPEGSGTLVDLAVGNVSILKVGLDSGSLSARVSNGGETKLVQATPSSLSGWHHLAVIFTGNSLKMLLDGHEIASDSFSEFSVPSGNAGLSVGANTDSSAAYSGNIDEFVLFSRALSIDESYDLYARGALGLQLSVRGCDDSSCVGESWIQLNKSSNLNVSGRYFQYKVDFSTLDPTHSPAFSKLTAGYTLPQSSNDQQITGFSTSPFEEPFVDYSDFFSLVSPPSTYTNSSAIYFGYIVKNETVKYCSLIGSISSGNLTNKTSVGVASAFVLNPPEGDYTWGILCGNYSGFNVSSPLVKIVVDRTAPDVSILDPSGVKKSLKGIPIQLKYYDAIPVSCSYSVGLQNSKKLLINGTNLTACDSSSFNVDLESLYQIFVYVKDAAGNVRVVNSSFSTILTSAPLTAAPAASSGGGGGGGGGKSDQGGLSGGVAPALYGIPKVSFSDVGDLKIQKGQKKTFNVQITNTGSKFLNSCEASISGDVSSWVQGRKTQSLAPGEAFQYSFDIAPPENTVVGNYYSKISLNCEEFSDSLSLKISVISGNFDVSVVSSERVGSSLVTTYVVKESKGQDQTLTFKHTLLNPVGEAVSEGQEQVTVAANQQKEFTVTTPLPRNTYGEFQQVLHVESAGDFIEFSKPVIVAASTVTGNAVSNLGKALSVPFVVVLVVVVILFFLIRVFRKKKGKTKPFSHSLR